MAQAAGKYRKGRELAYEEIPAARLRIEAGVPKARVAKDLGVSRQTLCAER